MNGLLLCNDLIFTSRIVATAAAAGITLRNFKTPIALLASAKSTPPRCVIADLHTPGLAIEEFAQELSNLTPRPTLVGYGSHVDAATLKRARDAGFNVVWPRSKFVEELEGSLPTWFTER